MTTGPDVINDQSFWDNWEDKFVREVDRLVTPQDRCVMEIANSIGFGGLGSMRTDVEKGWSWIYENIDYELSKEWKSPSVTISEGVGDCEDMDFLFLSMVPWMGATEADLVIGNFIDDDQQGAHTWVEVNGRVVDPTTNTLSVNPKNYNEERRMTVHYHGCEQCH